MKNIYKAGFIALVATPLFGLFSQNTYAIMPSTFNDENFYNCVVENFTSQYPDEAIAESGLTNEQLGKMSSLDCQYKNIADTTGLELMTSLTTLYLRYNSRLTSIDVSKNVNLTTLDLYFSQLTSIDVSKNVNLTTLDLFGNQLTSIDLSKNVNLTDLVLRGNQLTSIDVSKNVNLTDLVLRGNQLTSIDVSKNVNLTNLNLQGNQLTSIDVSKNVNLTELVLFGNQLTSIDVSKNVNLTTLDLRENQLTSIDVSKNVNLTKLFLMNNQLTSIDLSKNVNLTTLYLRENQLTSIDISKNPDLKLTVLVFFVDPTVVVETGVLPESDGDLSTYDFSKFQNLYLKNPCDELDDSLSEECVFEWDRENGRLNVSSSLIGSEVGVYQSDNYDPSRVRFKLKLTEPKPEELEEDDEAIVVPNTGAQIEDSNNSKELFPIFGMLLGTMTILFGMSLRSSYKRNEYK